MKKYTLFLNGRGGEYYLFPLNQEQKEKISCLDLKNPDYETILDILDVNDVMDAKESHMGAFYDSELFTILVFNEGDNENILWESPEDFVFEDDDYSELYKTDCLIVEDYIKGSFFTFEFECEEFDSKKLTPIVINLGNSEIITSFKYDGKDLSETKEYYDYWSKGFSYFLT